MISEKFVLPNFDWIDGLEWRPHVGLCMRLMESTEKLSHMPIAAIFERLNGAKFTTFPAYTSIVLPGSINDRLDIELVISKCTPIFSAPAILSQTLKFSPSIGRNQLFSFDAVSRIRGKTRIYISAFTLMQIIALPSLNIAQLFFSDFGLEQFAYARFYNSDTLTLKVLQNQSNLSIREIETLCIFLGSDQGRDAAYRMYRGVKENSRITVPTLTRAIPLRIVGRFIRSTPNAILVQTAQPFCQATLPLVCSRLNAPWLRSNSTERVLVEERWPGLNDQWDRLRQREIRRRRWLEPHRLKDFPEARPLCPELDLYRNASIDVYWNKKDSRSKPGKPMPSPLYWP